MTTIRAWAGLGAALLTACAAAGTDHDTASSGSSGTGGTGGAGAAGSATATTAGAGAASASAATTGAGTTASSGASSSGGPSGTRTVHVTPDASIPGQIIAAIEGATASIHMTMYILDDSSIVSAIAGRCKAGLDVRIVLNQTFPSGTNQTNPATYTTLTAAKCGVVWRNGPPGASSGAYTHEKTFVIDGKQAWIMTMNLDHSAPLYNREYVVVDDVAADVQEADQIFLADYMGTANASGAPLVVSPSNSRSALVALIDSATKTLDVEVEEFSDGHSDGVVAAVAAAAKRGVTTRVVLAAGTPSSSQTTAVGTVKAAGAKVVVSGGTSGGEHPDEPLHPRQGDHGRLQRDHVRERVPGIRELQRELAGLQPGAGRDLRRRDRAGEGRGGDRRGLQRGHRAVERRLREGVTA